MIGDLILTNNRSPVPPSGPRRRRSFWSRSWVKWLSILSVLALVGGLVGFWMFRKHYEKVASQFDLNQLSQLEKNSLVYDRNGDEIGSFFIQENRRPISLNEVPKHFIDALVAEEDSRFWQHHGVDYIGIGRAILATIKRGDVHQGASTITQQLARQAFGMASERTLDRKFKEIFLARRIESNFTKNQILEFYLNRIYFGSGFHGVSAAALGYYNKPVIDLTIEEAAVITGLIKAPNRCSPLRSIEEATKARNTVLNRMKAENYITAEEHARFKSQPIKLNPGRSQAVTGYLQMEVRSRLFDLLGEENLSNGGYKVYTTIDSQLQRSAEKAITQHLTTVETITRDYPQETYYQYSEALKAYTSGDKAVSDKEIPKPKYLQGALLAIDSQSGAVLAIVGGRDFTHSQYNRVTQGRRPAGSAFLPFVYACAFENGAFPGTRVKDTPMDNSRVMIGAITGILGEWGSEEAQAIYAGDITARKALVYSRNGATIRIGEDLGLDKVKNIAQRFGLQTNFKTETKYLLGVGEVSPAEMCLAYSAFANEGRRSEQMHLITKIVDPSGKTVFESSAAKSEPVQATDPYTAWQIHSCLRQSVQEGPGALVTKKYGLENVPVAGKTGTHSNFTDTWFVGYSNRVTCAVWAGLDRPGMIYENAFSRDIALPIWASFMKATLNDYPATEIAPPKEAQIIEICSHSGLRATDACYETKPDPSGSGRLVYVRSTYQEIVRPGYRVTQNCDVHSKRPDGSSASASTDSLLLRAPTTTAGLNPALANAVAIPISSPVVLGNYDPYDSAKPVLKSKRTKVTEVGDDTIMREPQFDLTPTIQIDQEKSRINLRPPDTLRIPLE